MRIGGGVISILGRAAAAAALLAVLVAGSVVGAEGQRPMPPDSDPVATLLVVAIGVALVTAWQSLRSRRTQR